VSQPVEQEGAQKETAEMVGLELHLEPVFGDIATRRHPTSIEGQAVVKKPRPPDGAEAWSVHESGSTPSPHRDASMMVAKRLLKIRGGEILLSCCLLGTGRECPRNGLKGTKIPSAPICLDSRSVLCTRTFPRSWTGSRSPGGRDVGRE
jgi:hypothetical protein